MELKVNMDMIVKNTKHMKLNANIVSAALNIQTQRLI